MKRTQQEIERLAEESLQLFNREMRFSPSLQWSKLEKNLEAGSQSKIRTTAFLVTSFFLLIIANLGTFINHQISNTQISLETEIEQFADDYQLNEDESIYDIN